MMRESKLRTWASMDNSDPQLEDTQRRTGSKTLDNGIHVLRILAQHPDGLPMTLIAREIGVHRTVAYRLLVSLTRARLCEQRANGKYVIGLGVLELARSVRSGLHEVARPFLRDLAEKTYATAFLAVIDGGEIVCTAVAEPLRDGIHVSYRVGQRHDTTKGADGMAALAGGPALTDERPEITAARERGYVVSRGEVQSGAWGLATWIVQPSGEVVSIGIISVGDRDSETLAPQVRSTARLISERLA